MNDQELTYIIYVPLLQEIFWYFFSFWTRQGQTNIWTGPWRTLLQKGQVTEEMGYFYILKIHSNMWLGYSSHDIQLYVCMCEKPWE